mmetsp:Transcript_23411/g.31367  ORF Transcript_23411/g.31367 Transcript_23411/m.31367 type:complete len:132 (-) Transcript_23411:77-472(-)|eukprot:CAMPEP_0170450978 /NCGR_PEP_ID=MMETSP0123-20130129/353_1 /TAXON_ID=182087 /ORGANISM="Favella ehrenbergii, Strain Fehren 1" /LENGTH=131 /DNA_ID=CAMNT_0010712477 /DNA_START=400 /DNA_END=795 /DNA_ORIENTATION=-
MKNEMDQDGKLDLEQASAAATVGAGFQMQEKSIDAMRRILGTLQQTEDVTIWTKEELQRQSEKLMVIDESLNRVEGTTARIKVIGRKLRKHLQADKVHCCLAACICLNLAILIILLFTTIGGEKQLSNIDD